MNEILQFLDNKPHPFFVATTENGEPRVRPFSFIMNFNGKLYFTTGASKPVYAQLQANPIVEICSVPNEKFQWMRLKGRVVFEDNLEAKKEAFKILPLLERAYKTPENPELVVFYLEDVETKISSL